MKLIEGVDYYWEGTKMIFTYEFLLSRGYCCNSKCKHCPYKDYDNQKDDKNETR